MYIASPRLLIFALLVVTTSTGAAASSPRLFELPDHGVLALYVPDGWTSQLRQPPNRLPPTILLKPSAAVHEQVLITTVWPMGPSTGLPDEVTLRSQVAKLAKSAETHSMEPTLAVQEITGVTGRGFYFVATDRAPSPGEYKYLTQGTIRVGDIALAFTILTNDGEDAIARAALGILKTAAHRSSY
jgi:hypothetical protein